MASFVVMEPPASGGGKTADAKFVRDGFVVPALVIPVLWMLWHRMWLEAGLLFLAMMLLGLAGEQPGYATIAAIASFGLVLFTGFEGANLRLASLRRKGWRDAAVIEAHSAGDAELRYAYDGEDDDEVVPVPPPLPAASTYGRPAAGTPGPALGLMSYPGHR
ncbi:MAG: DUF2628 domain-containing protein [Rhizobiaceae bacterium]